MTACLCAGFREVKLFLGYAAVVFFPGAKPPKHPQETPPVQQVPAGWTADDYQVYLTEARRDMDQQLAATRDIRARAQLVFTTALVLGGALVTSYSDSKHACVWKLVYLAAGLLTVLAGLAAGGIITARSEIGAPNLRNLLDTPAGKVEHRLVEEYAATRFTGDANAAVLVTVLRVCVLVLILGSITLACTHIWG
jgi:hypothetical protein